MSRMLAAVLLLALPHPGIAQPAPPIPDQTPVEIELLQTLSSETMKNGQAVAFRIVTPVVVDGVTVLEPNTPVAGEIKTVNSSGAWQKDGALQLSLKPILRSDGTLVQLDFAHPKLLRPRTSKAATAIGLALMSPVMLYYLPAVPIGVIAASRHGKPYEIRAGERYRVYVTSAVHNDAAQPAESADPKNTPPLTTPSRE